MSVTESKRIVETMKQYMVQYSDLPAVIALPCLDVLVDALSSRNAVLDSSSESAS